MGSKRVDFDVISRKYKVIDRPRGELTPFNLLVRAVVRTEKSGQAVETGGEFHPKSRPYAQLGRMLRKRGLGIRSMELPSGNRALWAATSVRFKRTKNKQKGVWGREAEWKYDKDGIRTAPSSTFNREEDRALSSSAPQTMSSDEG